MSTGTALVNARTPNLQPCDQRGHASVIYTSPEELELLEQQRLAACGPEHELDCLPPKNQQPGAKRRITAKPAAPAAPRVGSTARAIAMLVHNQADVGAFLHHLDTATKESLLSALADDLGLAIE